MTRIYVDGADNDIFNAALDDLANAWAGSSDGRTRLKRDIQCRPCRNGARECPKALDLGMWRAGLPVMAVGDDSIVEHQHRAYCRIGTCQSNCAARFIQSDAHEVFITFDKSHEVNIAAKSDR